MSERLKTVAIQATVIVSIDTGRSGGYKRLTTATTQSINQNLFSEQQKYYSVLQYMLALKRLPGKHMLIKLAA